MCCAAMRRKGNRRGSHLLLIIVGNIVGIMSHVHPSMFATQADLLVVKKLASLFILWVSLAAMAVT